MPESPSSRQVPSTGSARRPPMLIRISVPAEGGLRGLAGEVGAKIAESLGSHKAELASIAAAIDGLAGNVASGGAASSEITFEFHASEGELVVQARCNGRSSETRHPLPA